MTRREPSSSAAGVAARSAAALLAAVLITGCGGAKEEEVTPVVTVDVAPVLLAQIQRTIRAEGLAYPLKQAAIVPKVSAPIKRANVQRGSRVREGQILLELENRDLAAAAAESRAASDLAEATYQTTARATIPQDLQKAEVDARAAKDGLDAQQALYDNRLSLFKEGAIAQKDVNDALASLSQARAQYEVARKRLEDLQGFERDQALKAAAAQRDIAKGHYETSQAQLSYTSITSPIDGVVTDLSLYPGEMAQAGAPVVTVMDLSQVIVRTHVSQAEAGELAVGNAANVIGPGGVPIAATVTQISPALDATNTTVEVWVQAANPDGKLRPGTTIRVEMIARTVPSTLVIPQVSVLTTPTGATFAIVIDDENKPHLRKIGVGIRDSGSVQITDGLESGQRVATTGAFELFKLEPEVLSKTKVQIAPAKEEEEEPEES